MAISVSFFSQLEPASAGGVSPTQLKKYSQVRGEDAKKCKVSPPSFKLEGQNFKLGQLQKPFGKKNHPPFRFGSKNSPPKIWGFLQNQQPPSPQPNDSSKKILGAARCFVSPRDPKPTETTHRGFSLPRFSLERRNGRRHFVGFFVCFSKLPQLALIQWFPSVA